MEDEEIAGDREEHKEIETEEDYCCLKLLYGRVEEAEADDGTCVEEHDLQVALHNEEDDEGYERVGSEEEGDPEAEEEGEEDSEEDEEDEGEEEVGGEEAEGTN